MLGSLIPSPNTTQESVSLLTDTSSADDNLKRKGNLTDSPDEDLEDVEKGLLPTPGRTFNTYSNQRSHQHSSSSSSLDDTFTVVLVISLLVVLAFAVLFVSMYFMVVALSSIQMPDHDAGMLPIFNINPAVAAAQAGGSKALEWDQQLALPELVVDENAARRHLDYSSFLLVDDNNNTPMSSIPNITDKALKDYKRPFSEIADSGRDFTGAVKKNLNLNNTFSTKHVFNRPAASPSTSTNESTTHRLLQHFTQQDLRKDSKHFFEAPYSGHLDARFAPKLHPYQALRLAKEELTHSEKNPTLKFATHQDLTRLLRVFSHICDTHDLTFWIAHGSLLAWFWNQKMFPWDDDMDVQMPIRDLWELAKRLNNTSLNDHGVPDAEGKGRYLLDVNPNFLYRGVSFYNIIDARLVDTLTGRFLDVTAVADVESDGAVMDKTPHVDKVIEITPLVRVVFEGVPVWRPWNAVVILNREYPSGLISTEYYGYIFDEPKKEWVKRPVPKEFDDGMIS